MKRINLRAPKSLGLDTDNPYEIDFAMTRAIFEGTPQQKADVAKAINLAAKMMTDEFKRVNLSTTSLWTPNTEAGAALVFNDITGEMVDTRWASMFRVLDRRGARTTAFKITNTYNGVEFASYKLGERIKLNTVEATREWFELGFLAGGLQWNDFASRFTDDWDPSEGVTALLTRHGQKLAESAYATIVASGALSESYDTGGTTVLEKDINTVNNAIQKIEDGIYNATNAATGGAVRENVDGPRQYALLYYPTGAMHKRVKAMVQAMNLGPNDNISRAELNKTIIPIDTREAPATKFVLVYAGRKLVFAPGIDLEIKTHIDPTIAGNGMAEVGQSAQAWVRADSNQVCVAAAG